MLLESAPENKSTLGEVKRSAFYEVASLAVQPTGLYRGPQGNSFQQNILLSQQKLKVSAEEFKAEGLTNLAEQIEFSSQSEEMGAIGAAYGAVGTLVGGFCGPAGAVLGFVGSIFSSHDQSIEEIKSGIKQLEKDIIVVNQNLKQISVQIADGFNALNQNIQIVSEQIQQVQTDINMDAIIREIDDKLVIINKGITLFLNTLQNERDNEEKLDELASSLKSNFQDTWLTLYQKVAGTDSSLESGNNFIDLLSNRFHLSEGNISYELWLKNFQLYLDKLNFPIVIGALAICWAYDRSGTDSEISLAAQTYGRKYLRYFNRLYSVEVGLFFPPSALHVSASNKISDTLLEYKVERARSGDIITISNPHDFDVPLQQINIITNFKMSDPITGFWGEIIYPPEGCGLVGSLQNQDTPVVQEVVSQPTPDGDDTKTPSQFVAYTIQYNKNTYFKAKGSAVLHMSFSSNPTTGWEAIPVSGLLNAAMLPTLSFVNKKIKNTMKVSEIQINPNEDGIPLAQPISTESNFVKDKRIVGYFPNYAMYNEFSRYYANSIPFNNLNVISYCFAAFNEDAEVSSSDGWSDSFNLPIVQQALASNSSLMGELLLGGWPDETIPDKDYNRKFATISASPELRKKFARNLSKTIQEIGFSGVGIDWEYPTSNQANDYIEMLREIKAELLLIAGTPTLSIAAPASLDKINSLTEEQWAELSGIVDFINVMTYDYNGAWSTITDFMEPLTTSPSNPEYDSLKDFCVSGTMKYFIDLSKKYEIPLRKFAPGVATYGRALKVNPSEINDDNQGLYISHTPGDVPDSEQSPDGTFTNKQIFEQDVMPSDMVWITTGETVKQQSSWGYSKQQGWFISIDTQQSCQSKVDYEKSHNLGGMILWDLAGDTNTPENSLLSCISDNYRDDSSSESS